MCGKKSVFFYVRYRRIILPAVIVACIPNGISSNGSSGVSQTKGNRKQLCIR
jgi:hypothetical protein